jgi:hypothetical protein
MDRSLLRPAISRALIILAISFVASFLVAEIAFRLQPFNIDRSPQTIELTIPAGTADLVAAGQPVPAIPDEMVFVLGDVLVVNNQDAVAHELGPLLIPAGTSASMPMDLADTLAVTCSFTSTNYFGLDVKEPTTWQTRLTGVLFAAPPTALMVFLYSLAVRPLKPLTGDSTPA